MEYTGDLSQSQKKIVDLLTDMIQISDNEAFNDWYGFRIKKDPFRKAARSLMTGWRRKDTKIQDLSHTGAIAL